MDRGQSEAIASAVHDVVRGSVATQHDLIEVRHALESKLMVLQWMVGVIVTGVVALVAKSFF